MADNNKRPDKQATEKKEFDSSRRRFLKNSGVAAGGVVSGGLLVSLLNNPFKTEETSSDKNGKVETHPTEARMFFKRFEDFVVLEQVTERIYPKDDNGPGAIELGVPYFIDKQLAGSWGKNASDYRQGPFGDSGAEVIHSRLTRGELFINGLRKMNKLSQDRFDTTFDDAEEEQQIEILEDFEGDKIDMEAVSSASFFELLRMTVLEGAYSDPLYGGNKNMKGWEMKEFPGVISSYTDIIDSDDFVKMNPTSLTDYQQKS